MINFYSFFNNTSVLDKNYLDIELQNLHSRGIHEVWDYSPILHIIKQLPRYAYWYARDIIKGRWLEAEPWIMTHSDYARLYAQNVIKGRWPVAELYIMKSYAAHYYALFVIKGRWFEAEPYIMQDSEQALFYAQDIIKGRWSEAEPYLQEDKWCWKEYCLEFKI